VGWKRGKRKQVEVIVLLLREFARRTAHEHRANLEEAHGQLRTINDLARDILTASRKQRRRRANIAIAS
jgi:hypothetical protein